MRYSSLCVRVRHGRHGMTDDAAALVDLIGKGHYTDMSMDLPIESPSRYMYIIYTPNSGLGTAVSVLQKKRGISEEVEIHTLPSYDAHRGSKW